ncbi:androgen-dependent TFPI-regulating protein-like [Ischnura elegans]|uniref:androgen-dependent TFPI-regulating protein-like n=1 Tax=Ischnura elegans TaxID=197161 RepID=UPI001ED8A7F3|nr:androgen-dependent TFPI-regulating protein-like [Ischnura elegans]
MEVSFHWAMVAYYAYADITAIKGALQAHSFRSSDPEDMKTNRMIYGSFSYITIWNMCIQQLYFVMCCREHLLSKEQKPTEKMRKARQVLLSSILFPTTFVVAMIYWYEYWKSPTLVYGDILARIYPFWMDHVMHTFIVPIALVAMYLSTTRERAWGSGRLRGWLIYNAFLTFYITVVIIARLIRGIWPYPFLDPVNEDSINSSPWLFFLSLYAVGGIWYYIGLHLSRHILGSKPDGEKKRT